MKKEVIAILVALLIVYTAINFINPSLTGFAVYESGDLEVFNLIEDYDSSKANLSDNQIKLVLQESTTDYNVMTLNVSNLTIANEHKLNDEEDDYNDRLEKVIQDDNKELQLEKSKILNMTFSDYLNNNDVITVISNNANDKEPGICLQDGNCNISSVYFNNKVYNFTLNITEQANSFYLDYGNDVDIDYVYGLKNNNYEYSVSSYSYPEDYEIITEKTVLPDLSVVNNILINNTLNNQSVTYEYSTDNDNWFAVINPMNIDTKNLWIKITLYSNGNFTPVVDSILINYTSCVDDCFEN